MAGHRFNPPPDPSPHTVKLVTVEPGVYLPGRGGVRIEDSGVVRSRDSSEPGYEVLTLTSRDLVVL